MPNRKKNRSANVAREPSTGRFVSAASLSSSSIFIPSVNDDTMSETTPTPGVMTPAMVQEMINQAIASDRASRQGERSAAVRKEAITKSLIETRPQRKKVLIDTYKMSEVEAEMEILESDARAVRNYEPSPTPSVAGGGTFFAKSPIRVEDITEFDGDSFQLHSWLTHVEALHGHRLTKEWQEPIITLLPLCLKGAAKHWYDNLAPEERLALTNWQEWKAQLSGSFKANPTDLRRRADGRKWVVRKELIQSYYYEKVAWMRQAYPHRDDQDFILDIKEGLPADMQLAVRTNMMINPTLSALLTELRALEGPYRAEKPSTRSLLTDDTPAKSTSTSSSSTVNDDNGKDAGSGRRPPLAQTYDKNNITVDASGNRHYRIPDSGRKISLGDRRCRQCNGKHFDFEHQHLVNVKKEALYIDGMPACYFGDVSDDVDAMDEDADFVMLEGDQSTISSGSSHDSSSTVSRSMSPSTDRSASPRQSYSPSSARSSKTSGKGQPTSA